MTQSSDTATVSESKGVPNFYRLTRAIQDRFLASVSGTGAPRAVLFQRAPANYALGWLALLVLPLGGLAAAVLVGLGDLHHPLALQPRVYVGGYAALGGLAMLGLVGYLRVRARSERYPYQLGDYVFPVGVISARNEHLVTHPFADGVELKAEGSRAIFSHAGQQFVFDLPKDLSLEELSKFVEESTAKYRQASEQQSRRELAVLDPLRDSGFSNPLSSTIPLNPPRDGLVFKLLVAVVLGALVGGLLFFTRNKLGEQTIFKAALAANSVESYRAYLARGGARAEVTGLLLPRAELAGVRGSLEAVERYAAENTESAIRVEIEAALREELLVGLETARAAGTLAALDAFASAHPSHTAVASEIAAARKAVYKTAIERYRETSAAGDQVKAFFVDLIRHSEKHGPEVQLVFRRQIPLSAERSDSAVRKSAYYVGPSSLPSQYYNDEHAGPREKDAGQRVIERLQAGFSPEILKFVLGPTLEGGGALPAIDKPTLFVSYKPEMTGGYTTQRPRGVYVGIGLMVQTHFLIPDHKRPLVIKKFSAWLPPDVNQIWRDQLTHAQVYDLSGRDGLQRYTDKLLSILTPESPRPEGEAEVMDGGEPE